MQVAKPPQLKTECKVQALGARSRRTRYKRGTMSSCNPGNRGSPSGDGPGLTQQLSWPFSECGEKKTAPK
eukprot:2645456-Amphidinium_carterae.2